MTAMHGGIYGAVAEAFAPSALVKHGEDVCEVSWSPSPDPCENARASSQIVHMRPQWRAEAARPGRWA